MRATLDQIDEMVKRGVPSTHIDTTDGLSFSLLCTYRPFVGKFFLEMVSDTPLMPLPSSHFSLKPIENLILAEVYFKESTSQLVSHFKGLRHEIELGARSPYHAARIMELRAFSMDKKRGLVQERIFQLVRRFPYWFDYDLFSEMQQLFSSLSDEYFRCREVRQIARLLLSLYYGRKRVVADRESDPKRRHLYLSLSKNRLHFPLGEKESLSLYVVMSSLRENELFKKDHLLEAVQNFCREAELVKGSAYERSNGGLHLIGIEVEKEGSFTLDQIKGLKIWLPRILKGKVEHLQRSMFMPRNEEEILRHVVTLGRELRFATDLPQLIISFEKQMQTLLTFTIVIARVLLPKTPPIEEVLSTSRLSLKVDRVKCLGKVRNKYPKEGVVFKLELPLLDFLREDHAVDLYRARQEVLRELREIFGDLRDYNGGMISKQNELFISLKGLLKGRAQTHHHLLENFFHSLFPLEKRSFFTPEKLKNFFLLLLETIESPKPTLVKRIGEEWYVIAKNRGGEKRVASPLISLDLEHDGSTYFGCIYCLVSKILH